MSPDEQYQSNITRLASQPGTEGLLQQLRNTIITGVPMEVSPDGGVIGMVWDKDHQTYVPLSDMQHPLPSACAAMEPFWSKDTTIYTMLGVGLGYAAVALARRLLPYQRLVVWDPEPIFLKAALHCIDISEFSGKRVEIYVGNDVPLQLERWYMSLQVEEKLHMGFPIHHGYTGINAPPEQPCYRKAEYTAIHERIIELIRFHMVGLATWRQFGRHIGDNDIANMPEYFANPGFTRLKNLWQGKPAVCIAAGPSLQRNLRLLLPAVERRKVALITAGTTYALVQGLGLQPDIVTTIDFQYLNWSDQFKHIPLDPACSLVYLHSTCPQTPRRWPGPTFVAENSSDTIGWIRQFAGEEKGDASIVQTVAHLNVLVALMLGANPIILLGQDLSMPPDEHHAVGGRAQDAAPSEVPPDAFLEVPDMYGRPVKTRHSFQSMRMVFDRIIAQHPETTFYNCSEQGIHLQGAQHVPLADVLPKLTWQVTLDMSTQRPTFQAESEAMLLAREASPLRDALREASTSYVPPTLETLPAAFAQLCADVETIGQWATEAVAAWDTIDATSEEALPAAFWQCVDADETLSHAEVIEQLIKLPAYQQLIATEQILGKHPHATGMFVIRRFDFIELKGEIPPSAEELREPWQQARYSASRLVRAARMFLEELPILRVLLRRTQKRLHEPENITRAIARQLYRHAWQMPKDEIFARMVPEYLLAALFRHTQQYDAALAFLPPDSRHAQRIRQHLARYHADVRHAMPAYFQSPASSQPPPSLTAWDVMAVSLGGIPTVGDLLPISASLPVQTALPQNGHVSCVLPNPVTPVEVGVT